MGSSSLDIGATGLIAQQRNIDTIAHNIANITTTSYKKQRVAFRDLIYLNRQSAGTNSTDDGTILPTGMQFGLGVNIGSIHRIHTQGNLKPTSNELDLAINGKGFFRVMLNDGTDAYTRDGTLQLNQDGEIVTANGQLVSPGITVPDNTVSITINENGEVQATLQGIPTPELVGQIEIINFVNAAGLEALGDNMLIETVASGSPIFGIAGEEGLGKIKQFFLESSNADPVEEMTALITAQRAYEFNSKVISASDEILQILNQMKS